MMIISSISAIAATNDRNYDATLTISGLENGDTVKLYKILKWVDGEGWALDTGFTGCTSVLEKINAGTALNNDDIQVLTAAAQSASVFDSGAASGTSYIKDSGVEAGMYIALVTPKDSKTVYNPIIVSSDYNTENTSNTIDASSASIPTSSVAVAKKDTVTVTKTADDFTFNAGDEADKKQPVNFTINTTIPAYSKGYTAPIFRVTDELSTGLKLKTDSVVVSSGTVGHTATPDVITDRGFVITFNPADILALAAPQAVTITYTAYFTNEAPFTVNEEDNDVKVEFSNNPDEESDVTTIKDKTRHYTFSIDGSLFGDSSYQTGELVKVGKDSQGNIIESYKELDNGSSHGALSNAIFGLYKTEADANADTNRYTNAVFGGTVETDGNGLMEINGLDAGEYWLKEISAPAGYIKDGTAHHIVITADIDGDEAGETGEKITETLEDGKVIEYYVPVLRGYTITVDGKESSYTMTLDGPEISSVTPGDSSTEIVNTKGVELPSTGGIGTTIFYVGGSLMVLAAAILLITKRRMGVED